MTKQCVRQLVSLLSGQLSVATCDAHQIETEKEERKMRLDQLFASHEGIVETTSFHLPALSLFETGQKQTNVTTMKNTHNIIPNDDESERQISPALQAHQRAIQNLGQPLAYYRDSIIDASDFMAGSLRSSLLGLVGANIRQYFHRNPNTKTRSNEVGVTKIKLSFVIENDELSMENEGMSMHVFFVRMDASFSVRIGKEIESFQFGTNGQVEKHAPKGHAGHFDMRLDVESLLHSLRNLSRVIAWKAVRKQRTLVQGPNLVSPMSSPIVCPKYKQHETSLPRRGVFAGTSGTIRSHTNNEAVETRKRPREVSADRSLNETKRLRDDSNESIKQPLLTAFAALGSLNEKHVKDSN